jgi:hypothetical protein
MDDQIICRQRTIMLPDTITNYQYEKIQEEIEKLTDSVEYKLTDDYLRVTYNLKKTSFNDIWTIVRNIMLQNQYPPLTWWKYNTLSQLEANEKDHLANRLGWYKYVANIFVDHNL